ncbi:MAG: hypothetical protein JXA96_04180, partial [Sedimentisphaerales bacterium]|nr:hypothetical protein [Sedimentisphaerales bacterium]
KKIENLLRTAKFESNQDVNKSVLKNLLERFDRDNMQVSKAGLGRKIMQSKLSKFAAAAIVIIILYSGINFWGSNTNGVALGNVIESMQKMKWIHAKGTVQQAGQILEYEDWECFNPKIMIKVDPEGVIRYLDFENEVAYFYQPSINTISISPTTDRYNETGPESMTEIVKFMIEQFESEGGKVTRTKSTMDDIPVEIFNMIDERQDLILIVDAQKNLPISIESITHVPQMNMDAKSSVVIDYPEQGPMDIYSLGVPKDAQVIDNRPEGNTQNLINEIQKRFDTGFGNHIAVVLESQIKDNNVMEPVKIMVMRQKGNLKRLDRYNVYNFTGSKSNIPTLYSVVKDTWPELTIQDVLDLEEDKYAEYQLVFDGQTSSIRSNFSGREEFNSMQIDMFQFDGIESLISYSSINPTALMMTGSDRQIKPEIIPEDPNHTGLIGLRFIETMNNTSQRLPGTTIKEASTSYWFDPAKDYLLVESVTRQIRDEGTLSSNQKIIETAQTESGKWYPKIIVHKLLSPEVKRESNGTVRELRIMVDTNPVFEEGIFKEIKDSQ